MRKAFDLVLGLSFIIFGVGLGLLIFRKFDFAHIEVNRKLVLMILTPLVIIGVGVKRILMKHPAAPSR